MNKHYLKEHLKRKLFERFDPPEIDPQEDPNWIEQGEPQMDQDDFLNIPELLTREDERYMPTYDDGDAVMNDREYMRVLERVLQNQNYKRLKEILDSLNVDRLMRMNNPEQLYDFLYEYFREFINTFDDGQNDLFSPLNVTMDFYLFVQFLYRYHQIGMLVDPNYFELEIPDFTPIWPTVA